MINHFNRDLLPGGYLGVDIFFVISGYVITSSLMGNVSATLGDFLLGFYVRRLKRLAPALVFFVVVSALFICLLNPTPRDSLLTAITSLFGLSNLYLLISSTDYFAESAELNGFTHTWSLGVEEQFYLLFPLLLWFLAHGRTAGRASVRLLYVVGIVSVVSLIGYVVLNRVDQAAAYYLMPTRLWELGAGCVTFLLEKQSRPWVERIRRIDPLFAVVAVLAILFVPKEQMVLATMAVVIVTVLLIATLNPGTMAHGFFTQPAAIYLGLMSYSLYLWHWGVISLSRLTVGITPASVPFLVAAIFLLAFVSYRFVETPLRRAAWGHRRWLPVVFGLSAPALAGCLLAAFAGPLSSTIFLGRFVGVPLPPNLERTWWVDRRTGEYLETCHLKDAFSSEMLKRCLAIPPGKRGTVYLLGDSYARNYLPAVKGLFRDHAVAYLTIGGFCAFLPPALTERAPKSWRCDDYVEQTSDYVLSHAHAGDVVVIGQAINAARTSAQYIEFIKTFALRLSAKHVPAILLDGTAPPRFSPQECLPFPWLTSGRDGCSIKRTAVVNEFSKFDDLANGAATQVPNLFYAPLRTGLCNGDVCGQTIANGTAIWHDHGHITQGAALELTPLLREQLAKASFFAK